MHGPTRFFCAKLNTFLAAGHARERRELRDQHQGGHSSDFEPGGYTHVDPELAHETPCCRRCSPWSRSPPRSTPSHRCSHSRSAAAHTPPRARPHPSDQHTPRAPLPRWLLGTPGLVEQAGAIVGVGTLWVGDCSPSPMGGPQRPLPPAGRRWATGLREQARHVRQLSHPELGPRRLGPPGSSSSGRLVPRENRGRGGDGPQSSQSTATLAGRGGTTTPRTQQCDAMYPC